jgi:microcystin-dependent protein
MPDTYTPNLNLVLPEVGSSRDTWGSKLNSNTTILDQFVFLSTPIGALLDFAGPNAPPGWLIADGRAVSRTTYSALFAVIGTYWGAGDGSTTFALPSPNGRASIGPGTVVDERGMSYSYSFTQKAGIVTNVIAQVNLPNITLTSNTTGSHSHGGATNNAGPWAISTDAQGSHDHGTYTGVETAGHTHSGTTDGDGNHNHSVSGAWGTNGGPQNVSVGGGFSTGNNFTTSTNGYHTHTFTSGGASANHLHAISTEPAHAHNVTVTAHVHGITADGSHAHTIALGGSGTAFSVLQPIIVVTKIIFAGTQAATVVTGAMMPDALATDMAITDELATLRTELAELRAILMPPRSLRVMSSPVRGPH